MITLTPSLDPADFPQAKDYTPVAPGIYSMKVAALTLEQGPKAYYLNAKFSHTGEWANRGSVFDNVVVEGAAKFQWARFLAALGIRESVTIEGDVGQAASFSINGDSIQLVGRTFDVRLENGNNPKYNDVASYLPAKV